MSVHFLLVRFFRDAPERVQRAFALHLAKQALLYLHASLSNSLEWARDRKDKRGVALIRKTASTVEKLMPVHSPEDAGEVLEFLGSLDASLVGHVFESTENTISYVSSAIFAVHGILLGISPMPQKMESLSEGLLLIAEGEEDDVDAGLKEEASQLDWIRRNWHDAKTTPDVLADVDAYIADGLLLGDE